MMFFIYLFLIFKFALSLILVIWHLFDLMVCWSGFSVIQVVINKRMSRKLKQLDFYFEAEDVSFPIQEAFSF